MAVARSVLERRLHILDRVRLTGSLDKALDLRRPFPAERMRLVFTGEQKIRVNLFDPERLRAIMTGRRFAPLTARCGHVIHDLLGLPS